MTGAASSSRTAFVLGGGGLLGAVQAGMLRALHEAGVQPDLVVGTSVGALNGAIVARTPGAPALERLTRFWASEAIGEVFSASAMGRLGTLARTGTHLHSNAPLRQILYRELGGTRLEELPVRFQCCAANIERAAERWFDSGPVVDAVLASAAVPGLLPPVTIGDEHFLDGGLVNSIPVGRAVELGASRIMVLQVGRIDRPLRPPRRPWEVALVAFEIARRHRFTRDMASVPTGTEVHVLPTGDPAPLRYDDWSTFRYRNTKQVSTRVRQAYLASQAYLRQHVEVGG